jgi:hypothetical protein
MDKGGRFAAWEHQELFSAELCAAFRSLLDQRQWRNLIQSGENS